MSNYDEAFRLQNNYTNILARWEIAAYCTSIRSIYGNAVVGKADLYQNTMCYITRQIEIRRKGVEIPV